MSNDQRKARREVEIQARKSLRQAVKQDEVKAALVKAYETGYQHGVDSMKPDTRQVEGQTDLFTEGEPHES